MKESEESAHNGWESGGKVRQVLLYQAISAGCLLLAVVVHGVLTVAENPGAGVLTVLSGSVLALCGTLLNARSVSKASRTAASGGGTAMAPIFSGLLSKIVVVGGGIAFGLIYLNLDPVLLVASYLLVQFMSIWVFFGPGRARMRADGS